jgi:hypothetical protein
MEFIFYQTYEVELVFVFFNVLYLVRIVFGRYHPRGGSLK